MREMLEFVIILQIVQVGCSIERTCKVHIHLFIYRNKADHCLMIAHMLSNGPGHTRANSVWYSLVNYYITTLAATNNDFLILG
jgi:hypothetical protein